MVSVQNLTVEFTDKTLFDNISFLINKTDRIGLVGKNGVGKSTLLKIIAGQYEQDKGQVVIPSEISIGYLAQDLNMVSTRTVIDEVKQAFETLNANKEELEQLQVYLEESTDYESKAYYKAIERMSELSEQLYGSGEQHMDGEIEQVLMGLGFSREDFDKPVDTLSGGWKMRIELAKLLLQKHQLLLLDEPTNHLDIDSIEWLEQFLKQNNLAIVLISHDKTFLDNVTNRTIEITLSRIEDYKVNYSTYLIQRQERKALQLAAYENQQKAIQKTEEFIDRFRYKASKSVQVQSRIKQLDKIDRIEVDEEDTSKIHFKFIEGTPSGKVVFRLDKVEKSFDGKRIFSNVGFNIERGAKIAFVGKNGEGKSTLAKMLVSELEASGTIEVGHNVKIGYFAQDQDKRLDINKTVFQTLDDVAQGEVRVQLRNILGSFLFKGDSIDKKVRVLSGGERGRLALAKLLLEPYNVLILDEPTNHLDISSKEVLKKALLAYQGTIIVVSHDRDFLDGLCNIFYEFKEGNVKEFLGDLQEFLEHRSLIQLNDLNAKTIPEPVKADKKTPEKAPVVSDVSSNSRQQQQQIRKLEQKIEQLELEIKAQDAILNDPEQWAKVKDSNAYFKSYEQLKKELEQAMDEWLLLQ